jgi:hypothetical protein
VPAGQIIAAEQTNASPMPFATLLVAIMVIALVFRSTTQRSGPVGEAIRLVIGWTIAMLVVLALLIGTVILMIADR